MSICVYIDDMPYETEKGCTDWCCENVVVSAVWTWVNGGSDVDSLDIVTAYSASVTLAGSVTPDLASDAKLMTVNRTTSTVWTGIVTVF